MLGEKLLTRVWDTLIANGIGGLLEPWQERRVGRARADVRRHDMLKLAQTHRDIADIRAGRKELDPRGRLIPGPRFGLLDHDVGDHSAELPQPQNASASFLRHAQKEELVRSLERQVALAQIAIKIEEEAEGVPDEQVSNDEVDPDWITRWRSYAENVNSETVQRLWAQIFAGEVKSPGTYSLRTMDVLRQIQKREADIISTAASYCIGGFILADQEAEEIYERKLNFSQLSTLEQMGLIAGVGGYVQTTLTSKAENKFIKHLISNKIVFQIWHDDAASTLTFLPVMTVTQVGSEIFSLVPFTTDPTFASFFASRVRKMGYRVFVGEYMPPNLGVNFKEITD